MPQVSTLGPSGCDYTSVAAWYAAEGATDYGGPLVGVITGACVGDSVTQVTLGGSPPHDVIVRPPSGQEWDGIDLAPADRLLMGRYYTSASSGKQIILQDLLVELDVAGSVWGSLIYGYWPNHHPIYNRSGFRYINAASTYYGPGAHADCSPVFNNCVFIDWPRDVITSNTIDLNNCTLVNCCATSGGIVTSGKAPTLDNTLSINCGTVTSSATGDYNASDSDPTNVPGGNSVSATTADLVDYAGGDYRTKASSSLATAGSAGTFIGAFLEESGGGTTVEIPTLNNSATTYAPIISVTDHQTIEIPVSLHSITTYAPTITIGSNIDIEIPTLDNSAATYAPVIAVSDHQTVEIPTLDNSATTYAPTITTGNNVTVTIPTSTHAITTYAPDVSVTNHITVEIPVSLHKITTYAPTITTAETGDIYLTLSTPIIIAGVTVNIPIDTSDLFLATPIRETLTLSTPIDSADISLSTPIDSSDIMLNTPIRG